jgi:hypothetical protein
MRLPEAVASHPLARAMLSLFSSMWERRYEHVYSRGEALFNIAQQGHFSHTEVAEVLSASVTAFMGECSPETHLLVLSYQSSSRLFPPTYSCSIVKCLYNHPLGTCPGIPRSVDRRPPFLYVPDIKSAHNHDL